MKKSDILREMQNQDTTQHNETNLPTSLTSVEDEALKGVSGGCGGPSTYDWSCVPPGHACP